MSKHARGFWGGRGVTTHARDNRLHRCIEETLGRGILPLLEVWGEFDCGEMTLHGGHGHRAVTPRRTEVEVERVVLDVSIACVVLGYAVSQHLSRDDDLPWEMQRGRTAHTDW